MMRFTLSVAGGCAAGRDCRPKENRMVRVRRTFRHTVRFLIAGTTTKKGSNVHAGIDGALKVPDSELLKSWEAP